MRLFRYGIVSILLGLPVFFSAPLTHAAPMRANAMDLSQDLAQDLVDQLTFMKTVYQNGYAPASWKATFSNWNLENEYQKAVGAARSKPNLSMKEVRAILQNFIYSMKDYHVSIGFLLTEKATLPFTVKGAAGKLFIADIDRSKLSEDTFPFHIGDELVSFDGKAAVDAVQELQGQKIANVDTTDRALAELYLTKRPAARGYLVPQGSVTVGIQPKGSSAAQYTQLIWDYIPELIQDRVAHSNPMLFRPWNTTSASFLKKPIMSADVETGAGAHDLGARQSFIPALGVKIWETSQDNPFHAYIYRTADRKLIGYVRIPSYSPQDKIKSAAAFAQIISTLETTTDGLVIDQVNNPGGSVFYLYALASMLTGQPLVTPQHEMAITQADVAEALKTLEQLKNIKDDETAKKVLGETDDGYPISYQYVQFTINYSRFLINEWNAGRKLTRPFWIGGVDHINPNPIHYTKPILLLINALDFSGGDFFPAIMQDNKRVTILGTRTAGAGGYVLDINAPNTLGISSFRITGSLAHRIAAQPIENLGVTPDIEYQLSEKDLTQNYSEYVKAIQTAVDGIVK